jgi:HEAT repeat protein
MRGRVGVVMASCLLLCCGCGQKSTDELIADMKSTQERDRVAAVRLLPQRHDPRAIPTLIAALKDRDSHVRRSAAIGLGSFGEQAREAIPDLQMLAQKDRDARIREAATTALSRIDPAQFPANAKEAPK